MWKWITTGVVLALIVLWAVVSIGEPRSVEIAPVVRGGIDAFVEERATTRVAETWVVSAPFDGRVLPIRGRAGTPVRAGETVAQMELIDLEIAISETESRIAELDASIARNDDARLERTLIAQAEAALQSMDRTVEAAEERTRASRARSDFFKQELERREGAYESQAISETELNRARVAYVEADVDTRSDVLSLRATEAIRTAVSMLPRYLRQSIEKKGLTRVMLERERAQAQKRLERLLADRARAGIVSPVDGVVTERMETSRRHVLAGTALMEIADPGGLEIEIEMLTEDAAGVEVGDRAEIFGAALGDTVVPGRVSRIYPRGFTKVSSLGVEQQRVLVIVEPDATAMADSASAGRNLGLEYRVRARVITGDAVDVLVAPRAALFRGVEGGWQVFVVRGGRARLVDVVVGIVNDEAAEIVEGVGEGDSVILVPSSDLKTGERVRTSG